MKKTNQLHPKKVKKKNPRSPFVTTFTQITPNHNCNFWNCNSCKILENPSPTTTSRWSCERRTPKITNPIKSQQNTQLNASVSLLPEQNGADTKSFVVLLLTTEGGIAKKQRYNKKDVMFMKDYLNWMCCYYCALYNTLWFIVVFCSIGNLSRGQPE